MAGGGEFENSLGTETTRLPLARGSRQRRMALLRRACRGKPGAAASLLRGACGACVCEDGRRVGRNARAAGRILFGSSCSGDGSKQQPYLELFDGDGPVPQGDHQPGEKARWSPAVSAGGQGERFGLGRSARFAILYVSLAWRLETRLPHNASKKLQPGPDVAGIVGRRL